MTEQPAAPTPPPKPSPEEYGGDAVCWLPRVCDECGRLSDTEPPTVCTACGATIPLP